MLDKLKKYPVPIITVFIWIGFVCSISFMESWIKFHAENVTLPIGLSIGRVVFGALNKVEWAFAILILAYLTFCKSRLAFRDLIYFIAAAVLLILQTFWLLPVLDIRAGIIIQGGSVPPSPLHFFYVAIETLKIVCLFLFGSRLFKYFENKI
jgi:hypothetical protein